MITKFEKYNEGIKHLLVGPTKKEVWKNLGFDKPFDTPEEFIDYILNNLEYIGMIDTDFWKYKDEIYFKYNRTGNYIFYFNEKNIGNLLFNLFNLDYKKQLKLMKYVTNGLKRYPSCIESMYV